MQNRIILYVFIIFSLIFLPEQLYGTHNRAGEITYKHISGFTFEVTVTTYTYRFSQANREYLTVQWGDGASEDVQLKSRTILPNDYYYNTYVARHTYPGTGVYQILMEDPNRNLGIQNIPNSVNTLFSIKTTMLIGQFSGTNSTPVLLNPPIDKAAKGHIFIHNPAAFDVDGDSITYELTTCTAENGLPIAGYTFPPASDTLYINQINGDLIWDSPTDTGAYNIAIFVNEWRDGVKIGRIARDMQINVYNSNNNPPVNSYLGNYCVEAGKTLELFFTSTDPDNDPIEIDMRGGPLIDSSADVEIIESRAGYIKGKFTWKPDCDDARQQPYSIILKSQDKVSNDISLVDITSFEIKVLHNSPKNLKALPGTDTIRLEWDVTQCGNAAGYKIYRRVSYFGFNPDSCENGVPAYTGYELHDVVAGKNVNYYTDDNHGAGMVPGYDYCYMITAYYYDNAESFATPEVCTNLVPGVPAMLQVSVLSDNVSTGSILVSWAAPRDFDTVDDGPYRYQIYRMTPNESNYKLIATKPTISLLDTFYIDNGINTLIYPYYYSAKLFYLNDQNNWVEFPGSETASSLYLGLTGRDNTITLEMKKRTPWKNYQYNIFRKQESSIDFDSIASTIEDMYVDDELANDIPYTYRVKSMGTRPLNNIDYTILNISHINTTAAKDSFPPCAPILKVESICDSSYNLLTWTSPYTICGSDDVVRYKIYYRPTLEGNFQVIEEPLLHDTIYKHTDLETLAAVYGISAIDSFGNESDIDVYIIDTCLMFYLPNVFSPDGDGINDIYTSYNLGGFVKKVEMKIYNRYGQLIYETPNPFIEWDGMTKASKKTVPTGVYYYLCDVYEPRLTGETYRTLKGFIHVFSGNNNSTKSE
jgi:gliding motility-associated-like protein